MAVINQEIIRYNNQEEHDYADTLEPGYRFCPTDPELIVYYLKPKIETEKRHPNCRYYEVNIYDCSPDGLTAKPEYRSCENKWYFLTWMERKHPNGSRPNRQTRNGGRWKASQARAAVKDVTNRVVGSRLSLDYFDEKKRKTPWLMHEYTTKNPNISKESQKHNTDKNMVCSIISACPKSLINYLLSLIYSYMIYNQFSVICLCSFLIGCFVRYTRFRNANNNLADLEEAIVEQNHQSEDEPSLRRRRLSTDQESYQSNGAEHVHIQKSNHQSGTNVQIVAPVQIMLTSNQQSDLNNVHVESSHTFPSTSMYTSPNSISMQHMPMLCGSYLIHPPFEDPQDFLSKEQAPAVQLDTNLNPMTFSQTLTDEVFQKDCQNSYHDTPSLYEDPMMVPEAEYSSYNPDSLMGLENFESLDPSSENFSIDDLMALMDDECD
ncbi:NAC domain-containing protein [Artemisia annua]|uniref:NAC domain-containing protein n=1 Tax=Artemisia annua TaxID=35608 RepID=A0A2U1NLW0_ARTAN|nr:NAC domain-containing protein [Artemisia annua]